MIFNSLTAFETLLLGGFIGDGDWDGDEEGAGMERIEGK